VIKGGDTREFLVVLSPEKLAAYHLNPGQVADAIKKTEGIVDVLNGIDNTISGPATLFQVDPTVATRAGFTPEEVEHDIIYTPENDIVELTDEQELY
jgi:multidrug efflux pump subunit AcrB